MSTAVNQKVTVQTRVSLGTPWGDGYINASVNGAVGAMNVQITNLDSPNACLCVGGNLVSCEENDEKTHATITYEKVTVGDLTHWQQGHPPVYSYPCKVVISADEGGMVAFQAFKPGSADVFKEGVYAAPVPPNVILIA